MQASNSKMSDIIDPKEQFRVTKSLLDSFYMTFAALIVSSLATQLITPIYQFYHSNKGVPVQRDISFGLSFMCQAIFYVGYFVAFDCNIIILMFASLLVLLVGEVALFKLGLIEPTRVCYSIIGNYFTAMLFGLLPISISAFLMLSGNKLGIKTIDLGKEYLGQSSLMIGLLLLYLVTVVIFGALYKNERLLKRVQSMIWKVNEMVSVPQQILGSSYRNNNPVYNFETKVKSD
jgi:hypothetical protein